MVFTLEMGNADSPGVALVPLAPGASLVPVAAPVPGVPMAAVVPEVPGESEGPPWPRSVAERIGRRASSTTSLIAASCSGVKASH